MLEKRGDESDQRLYTAISVIGKKRIECVIYGPSRRAISSSVSRGASRPIVEAHYFDSTIDGLRECLAFAKDVIYRYHSEGMCPSCDNDTHTKLKASKMPRCSECMIAVSIGLRP